MIEISLDDLDLDAVLGPKGKKGAKKENKPKHKPGAYVPPKIKPSPWRAIALTLPVTRIICDCGHSYSCPAGNPLVRFQNTRNKTLWEVAGHPSAHRRDLPRFVTWLTRKVTHCPKCWKSETLSETDAEQLDLFFSRDSLEALDELMTLDLENVDVEVLFN